MSGGTDVRYNGILMSNVVTRRWEEQLAYDETGTDVIAAKYQFEFEGILHAQNITRAPAAIGNDPLLNNKPTAIGIYDDVQRRLSDNRKVLEIRFNDRIAFVCRPTLSQYTGDKHRDVDNGPKPREVKIERIASDQVFRVSFSIECSKVNCLTGNIIPAVLNNRWSVGETMDANFFTTRTIRGKMKFSSSPAIGQDAARLSTGHAKKHIVIPGLENGFRRESIEFTASASGLEADYQITDKQVHVAAPWPATKISGTHTESTTVGGTVFHSDCTVRLDGAPHADKRDLINLALRVMDSRLRIITGAGGEPVPPDTWYPQQAAIVDYFGEENSVEVSVRVLRVPPTADVSAFVGNLYKDSIGSKIEIESLGEFIYDPSKSTTPEIYGYDPYAEKRGPNIALFVLHCYLQSPCLDKHSVDQGEALPDEKKKPPPPYPPPTVTGREVEEIPSTQENDYHISPESQVQMYTLARAESRYAYDYVRSSMPIARVSTNVSPIAPGSDTTVVFDLAQPQACRIVRIEAERVGAWPQIPQPVNYSDGNIRGVILEHWEQEQAPTLSPDGKKKIYHIEAYYKYALNRMPLIGEKYSVGVLPNTDFTQEQNKITRGQQYSNKLRNGNVFVSPPQNGS